MTDGFALTAATAVDEPTFRRTLGHFATGVAVVTARTPDGRAGMAVNSFTSVSLDPPLVLFCVAKTSTTWPDVRAAGHFCVNILRMSQLDLAKQFSGPGDRFVGVGCHESAAGSPVIDAAAAYVDCTMHEIVEAGDHLIVVGHVTEFGAADHAEVSPLVFYRGRYSGVWGEGVSADPIVRIRWRVSERLAELPEGVDATVRLATAAEEHLRAVIDMSDDMKIIIGNLRRASPEVREAIRVEERLYAQVWTELLELARTEDLVSSDLSVDAVRTVIMTMLNCVVEWWMPGKSSLEELVVTIRTMVLASLGLPTGLSPLSSRPNKID